MWAPSLSFGYDWLGTFSATRWTPYPWLLKDQFLDLSIAEPVLLGAGDAAGHRSCRRGEAQRLLRGRLAGQRSREGADEGFPGAGVSTTGTS